VEIGSSLTSTSITNNFNIDTHYLSLFRIYLCPTLRRRSSNNRRTSSPCRLWTSATRGRGVSRRRERVGMAVVRRLSSASRHPAILPHYRRSHVCSISCHGHHTLRPNDHLASGQPFL